MNKATTSIWASGEEDDAQGAGNQGMMFGYATNETANYMSVSLDLAQFIMRVLADIRKKGKAMTYWRPGSKIQLTIEYSDNNIPKRIDTIVETISENGCCLWKNA